MVNNDLRVNLSNTLYYYFLMLSTEKKSLFMSNKINVLNRLYALATSRLTNSIHSSFDDNKSKLSLHQWE